ncbi:hypothetical protein VKT23_004963 [Stygiomarasmius scandens]|uniref:ATP synthase protein MI25 n=1 Tax=Marasmiellus scandens TaxID=2682957 RepID=A0ABR1JSP5_9AGAR
MVALAFSEVLDTFEKLLAGFTYSILLLVAILYFNEAFVRKVENLGGGGRQKMAMQDKKKRRKRMKKIKWKKKKARSRPEAASDPGCNPSPPTNSVPKQEAGARSKEDNGGKHFGTDNRAVVGSHSAPGVMVRSAGAPFKKRERIPPDSVRERVQQSINENAFIDLHRRSVNRAMKFAIHSQIEHHRRPGSPAYICMYLTPWLDERSRLFYTLQKLELHPLLEQDLIWRHFLSFNILKPLNRFGKDILTNVAKIKTEKSLMRGSYYLESTTIRVDQGSIRRLSVAEGEWRNQRSLIRVASCFVLKARENGSLNSVLAVGKLTKDNVDKWTWTEIIR